MSKHISSFECHITTTVGCAEVAEQIAKETSWKTSEIKRDPLLGDGSHFYLTAHDTNYDIIYRKMRDTADILRAAGCEVLREKIEGIIYDTKTRNYGGDEHLHVDDLGLNDFAKRMKQRLLEKRSQGYGGWDDPARCQLRPQLLGRLANLGRQVEYAELGRGRAPVVAGCMIDLANYAMMAYHRIMNGVANPARVTFCKKCDAPDYSCACTPAYKERQDGTV